MEHFRQFITQVEALALKVGPSKGVRTAPDVRAALNGEVAKVCRTTVSLCDRRKHGIFFTSESLARRVTRKFLLDFNDDSLIVDPACGTGDLLIACANKMPFARTLRETLHMWSKHLSGFDVFPEFIKATKARLILLAKLKTNRLDSQIKNIDRYFPLIRVQDFLKDTSGVEKASHIILNPPYNIISVSGRYQWANKKVSAASIFMDICISAASANTKIRAILPDVLRAGSSYGKWRKHIASTAKKINLSIYGRFDEWTDVDVFVLRLQKAAYTKQQMTYNWGSTSEAENTLGHSFDVHVGPVVPHRDRQEGPCLAYLHARTAGAWSEISRVPETRKYSGNAFTPPFVVVRRTSRPGDKRAIGTIVKGKRKVAIENHLLVLLPKKKTLGECRAILRILKSKATDEWLNQRIRCRHLTVEALKTLPIGVGCHG